MEFRPPVPEDGMAAYLMVKQSPPLDLNSAYCYLLQCTHFAQTSVVVTEAQHMLGFVSGYLKPEQTDTMFIWQVAVSEQARGQGLGLRMLEHILNRKACDGVTHLETTITESNQASWALFERLAEQLGAQLTRSVLFDQQRHFAGVHDSEILVRIGPF